MNKVAIFVDVQNIYYTTRQEFGRNFDYRTFWSRVTADREVIAAFAYAIERDDGKQKAFQQILRDIGFEVKLKPYIQRSDGSAKGDWDVGITLDIVEQAEHADVIVLASGDGDFDLALDRIRTTVWCHDRSLRRQAVNCGVADPRSQKVYCHRR